MTRMVANLFMGEGSSTFERPSAWLVNALGGSSATKSGVNVSADNAQQIAAVYAAIRNISEDLAKIPLKVFERTDSGKIENTTTPAARVIIRPNADLTAMSFRESLVAFALGRGNGLAEIVRDGSDRPRSLELIHPSRAKPHRTEEGLFYRVLVNDLDMIGLTGAHGDFIDIPQRDMIHVRGHGEDVWGKSVIRLGAESMGIALAAQQTAASFFGNGMSPSGVFTHPQDLNEKARTNLREWLKTTYGGSKNAGKQMVLWGGMTYSQISVNPDDAQLMESRLFQTQEIARWFRIPLSKIQENTHSTYSNSEQESLAYIVDTLHAWSVRIEQEFQRKLFLPSDTKHFVRHKLQALMRGDMKTRGEFYKTLFNTGAVTPDQIREFEDMNTLNTGASGATYLQSGMTTIDLIYEGNNIKNADVPRETDDDESGDEETDQEESGVDNDESGSKAEVPQGMKAAMSGLVERCLTRQHRACATSQKKSPEKHAAWAAQFFMDERAIMRQALTPVIDDIVTNSGDAMNMIDDYCIKSAKAGQPSMSVTEFTEQLLEAMYAR